jgi:glycosyltransferase involved in cell wall biosynthesis
MGVTMKIANVMFSRGRGGIEQAFLDYNEALSSSGLAPVSIISRGAQIESRLKESGITYYPISQCGWWDLTAALRLAHIFRKESVSAIITHGNRALSLASLAFRTSIPVIAVVHNYNMARLNTARAVIATTADLRDDLAARKRSAKNLFVIPNIVHVCRPPPETTSFHDPPVIGAMGRMVKKKGFEILCAAMGIMKARGVSLKLLIAGDGPERAALEARIYALGLKEDIKLIGWIEGAAAKEAFWRAIDIFCLPSLHEPFGIVLLEAWAAGKPVIITNTEGPRSIAAEGEAVIVDKNDPDGIARALELLLEHPEHAHRLAVKGYNKVIGHYNATSLAPRLNAVVRQVLS